jgi:hypothetical protein
MDGSEPNLTTSLSLLIQLLKNFKQGNNSKKTINSWVILNTNLRCTVDS